MTAPVALFPDLAGKVAVITGATKGIGRECARLLADNGCRIAVVARSSADVEAVAAELGGRGAEAVGIAADAADAVAVAGVRTKVEAALGTTDILLPYAGGFDAFTVAWETTLAEWDEVLRSNLTATFLALREFVPGMVARGSGSVVLMSSISARVLDKPTTASYAAAKGGVLSLMRHSALEAAPHGVRINAIAPGTLLTERIERIMTPDEIARTAALSPLGTIGTAADCAAASAFLASDASGWITGVTLDVSGGRVML